MAYFLITLLGSSKQNCDWHIFTVSILFVIWFDPLKFFSFQASKVSESIVIWRRFRVRLHHIGLKWTSACGRTALGLRLLLQFDRSMRIRRSLQTKNWTYLADYTATQHLSINKSACARGHNTFSCEEFYREPVNDKSEWQQIRLG